MEAGMCGQNQQYHYSVSGQVQNYARAQRGEQHRSRELMKLLSESERREETE
jgi:hypothetical protein